MVLEPAGPIAATHNGADVRVDLTVTSTNRDGLSVPVAAVYSQPDGQTVVVAVHGEERTIIPVTVDAVVGGFAIVAPLAGHDLAVNDQVIVSGPGFN